MSANKNATVMILDGVGPVEQTLPKLAPVLKKKNTLDTLNLTLDT